MTTPARPSTCVGGGGGSSADADPTRPAEPIPSGRIFAGAREVQIVHRGVTYRLKQTALGKLILTK